MPFTVPSYDELLNAILTDYINQFPGADTSKGSLIYIKAAATASAFWGLYQYQRWSSDQIFPDTGDTAALEHHAYVRGLARKSGETDAALLTRLLDYIRRPPAGGNKYDYVKWALEITNVTNAYCVPLGQGPGTVDVVIFSDVVATGSEIPDADLLAEVRAYIVDICPSNIKALRVLAPGIVEQDITMECPGAADLAAISSAVTAYVTALLPGQTLYRSQLFSVALAAGAADVILTLPAANVVPDATEIIRPGVVSVT